MNRVKLALIASLFTLACVCTTTAQIVFESGSPTELYKKAGESDKLVFMDIYASWCPPCKMMERDVFSRSDVGDFMTKSFVSSKFNIDETEGRSIANKYGIQSIPTYLVFTKSGELVGKITGGMSSTEFIANMQKMIDQANK